MIVTVLRAAAAVTSAVVLRAATAFIGAVVSVIGSEATFVAKVVIVLRIAAVFAAVGVNVLCAAAVRVTLLCISRGARIGRIVVFVGLAVSVHQTTMFRRAATAR